MTRTTYHKNSHDNDADDDKDGLSGIVSRLVVCGLGFLVHPSSPTAKANIKNSRPTSMLVPRKVIELLIDLHHDETTINDKWLTLEAVPISSLQLCHSISSLSSNNNKSATDGAAFSM
jgi:hypothetical protein